jgi:hypothetical protein
VAMPDADGPATPHERARRLLTETDTATLATASPDGRPEAATVRFVADGFDLSVTTQTDARKYQNLLENPTVAVVVDGTAGNLQLEGEATALQGDRVASFERRYRETYGPSEYLTNDESVCFGIETTWARLLVDGGYPPTYETLVGDDDARGGDE